MNEYRSELINFEEEERKSQERIKASLDIKITVKGGPMDRLESIKERLNLYKATDDSHYIDDVEYLLQRLEIAQKALEHYVKVDNWYPDDYKGTQIFIWDDNTKPWEVAKQALDQLKE